MRIGIDVGGTNTDAVLVEAGMVLATVKWRTSPDVLAGIREAVAALLDRSGVAPAGVDAVMVGTTHFGNALAQGTDLLEVACVRIGLPAGRALPPLVDWPARLRAAVGDHVFAVGGGHEYDGRRLAPLDEGAVRAAADEIAARGLRAVAISSIFSPANDESERRVGELIAEAVPDASISLSSEIGRMGLLERENATIVNASLSALGDRITGALRDALAGLQVRCPVYISQNDGTLMTAAFAERFPVLTFASGPTNSMRGAAVLSGERDCAVIDVGGTTTDLGMLVNGFPRAARASAELAGVRTNFRMPDLISLGLGGGSIVTEGGASIGPLSVGYDLVHRARVFGGDTITATDVAVAAGRADIGSPELARGIDGRLIGIALARIDERIADALDRVKTLSSGDVPVVLVGGGGILLSDMLAGATRLIRPSHYAVANALGAAIAQVGGEVDQIFSLGDGLTRAQALDRARELAAERAVEAGAAPGSVRIVDVEELSIAYVPGNAMRVRAKAVGDLDTKEERVATHR
jgi:N-methylhydantoinase A/oxoprolinase/acetone carboxylase beta subunit